MRPHHALIIIIVTLCLFVKSTQTRQLWMQPTYSIDSLHICPGCSTMYEWLTAHALVHVNNWLQENPLQLRFALFHTPRAIEAQTSNQRIYYGSYPPGAILPLYVMINILALFEPDIRHDRIMQLRMIIAWNHACHMLLALVLCCIVYFTLRRVGCDALNATLMACTPAIVQYSNAHSLFWFNLIYSFDQAVLLPCALYVLLELASGKESAKLASKAAFCNARLLASSSHSGMRGRSRASGARKRWQDATWKIPTMQALVAFYGTLTDWLFVFFIAIVYLLRLTEGRIVLPRSYKESWNFLHRSFWFFLPSLSAITIWLYQVQHFGSHSMLGEKLVSRMGLDIPTFMLWTEALTSAMFRWPELGYGASGVTLLYIAFYVAMRVRLRERNPTTPAAQAANCYLLLYVPCLAHVLFFVFHSWDHLLSSLKLSLALSVLFALLPYMVMRSNHTRALFYLGHKPIYVTTTIVLVATVIFGYVRSREATRFFSLPDAGFVRTGNFIRTNTVWQDVVFSREPVAPVKPPQMLSLAGRVVHVITNLDHVYQKVQDIAEDFTIKIFYYPQRDNQDIDRLVQFLAAQDLPTSLVEDKDKETGGLLAFDGKAFVYWYRKAAQQ